ncbi:MAG: hypothetical protein NTX56_17060 [Proteobacteria bacterium]|nr:hypothetical protein [Pseudomonadota bacterium]
MKAIFKYPLRAFDWYVPMPIGAEIIALQVQDSVPTIWAIVDASAPKQQRRFRTHGTGHPLPDDPGKHVGTYQEGPFVWHVFEVPA